MKKGFVKMNLVNAIAMKDQFLEEETRRGSIVRKTIQSGRTVQPSGSFLHRQKGILKRQGK